MGAFDFKQIFKKSLLSKELSIILENSCVNCYCQFNQENLAPYQAYPCQHAYCASCVQNVLFAKGNQTTECIECPQKIEKRNIKKSRMILQVLRIISAFANQKETPNSREQIEKKVAIQLYSVDNGYFYSCGKCDRPYDRNQKLPNIVCQRQHLLCSECLSKSGRFNCCEVCGQDYLQEIFTNKLIINTSQFIHNKLFCETVRIVVNQKQFTIVTHSQTTIKDIFHILQEFDHISNKLEINLCKFYVIKDVNYSSKREEVPFTERVGSGKIKKIYLEFSQDALNKGGNITMSSKFLQNLPIKINNFQQERRPNLDKIQEDIFGQTVSKTESKIYLQKQKEKQLIMKKSISKKQIRSSYENYEKIKNQPKKPQKSQISLSKLNLAIKSKALQKQQSFARQSKISKIKRNKQAPPGTQITPKFIENVNTTLSFGERAKILPLFLQKHQVQEANQQYLCYEVQKALNIPFTKQQFSVSQKMEKQISQKVKQGDLLSLILYIQKKELESEQIKVIFNPKSSIRSKLTLKTLTSHILTNRFMVTQKIDEDEEFFFERMSQNQQVFRKFIQKHTSKYTQKFGLSRQSIVIHNLIKGSNILTFSTNQGDILCKYLKNNLNRDIQIHPYFTQLQLSPQDFDQKGNIKFNQQKKDIEFRGNWPYYQPIKSVRYGIKVSGMFDNGDNVWLKMKNVKGQWAVGFHGVRNPNQAYKQYKNVIMSILSGLHQPDKSMLILVQNARQAYSNDDCANKPGQKVGNGVYLSPMISETLPYTSAQEVGDKSYHLVFQCRLKPNEIRIPQDKHNYWIVRHPAAIRPYGIVLIEGKDRMNYPTGIAQFGQSFNYEKYKARIESNM